MGNAPIASHGPQTSACLEWEAWEGPRERTWLGRGTLGLLELLERGRDTHVSMWGGGREVPFLISALSSLLCPDTL